MRSTLLEAPSVLQPNYEWMSVIDSRACWNIGNGQRVKMLGDNWFLGQVEFELWSSSSTLVIRLIEDDANNGNSYVTSSQQHTDQKTTPASTSSNETKGVDANHHAKVFYKHTWPRIIVGTIIGFLGSSFGTVGGVGGGGIFVPMLTLIIGFDAKSATAISKLVFLQMWLQDLSLSQLYSIQHCYSSFKIIHLLLQSIRKIARDAFDHAQQAARVFKNRSSLRSTLLEAPSVPQPNYEWMSVIDSRACRNIGNGQRVKMLGDNWFLGQA
ncbi:hypothetical protein KIW84_035944 [Lathyrus oleraceus]|uniref:Sulfite exporter TauE/SafE family protein n=1 Tax=Pisum sativum TaxID=3888 RepID=A0A9D4Y2Y5_PEA|nr:hypothetical protein KIW84_035944 [Pisum sativum]